jgi:hypothetical protein
MGADRCLVIRLRPTRLHATAVDVSTEGR